jgi:malate/lactate dehydrogenase
VFTGVPAIINKNGWKEVIQWNLTTEEQTKFDKSVDALEESYKEAEKAIK